MNKVSKHKLLLDAEIKLLREKKLIEDKKPNFIIAGSANNRDESRIHQKTKDWITNIIKIL